MKQLLALMALATGLMASTYECKVYESTLNGEAYYPKNMTVKIAVEGSMLFTARGEDVYMSVKDETITNKNKNGILYEGYTQKNGFTTLVYDHFKEGIYIFRKDGKLLETIVGCQEYVQNRED